MNIAQGLCLGRASCAFVTIVPSDNIEPVISGMNSDVALRDAVGEESRRR